MVSIQWTKLTLRVPLESPRLGFGILHRILVVAHIGQFIDLVTLSNFDMYTCRNIINSIGSGNIKANRIELIEVIDL